MKKHLKILQVFNGSYVSGPEVSTIPGIPLFSCENNQDNSVICHAVFLEEMRLEGVSKNACRSYAKTFGLKTFAIDVKSRLDMMAVIRLRKLIKEENYSHVHGQDVKATIYIFLATLGISICRVSTFHGFTRFGFKDKFYERLYFFLVFFFQQIVTVSEDHYQKIKKKYFWLSNRMLVIENAIARPPQKSLSEINQVLEKIAPLPPHPWGIMLARFSPEKNHITLFKALKRLNVHESLVVWLFGFGALENDLKKLAQQMGVENRIIFGGHLAEGSSYLSAFDYFFLVSTSEGMPMSLLEAASLGITIIGSDIPGIKEVIPSIDYGFLSDPLDEVELALNIKLAMAVPLSQKKEMGEKLKLRIHHNFSLQDWANKHLELYRQ